MSKEKEMALECPSCAGCWTQPSQTQAAIKDVLSFGENPFRDGSETYRMYEEKRKEAIDKCLEILKDE